MVKKEQETLKKEQETLKKEQKIPKKDENHRNLIKIFEKIGSKEYKILRGYISESEKGRDLTKKLDVLFASRKLSPKLSHEKKETFFHSKEITRINYIINNPGVLKQLKGLKILLHGPTGSGKTTIAKKISTLNSNIPFLDIKLEEYVSSKMGQTQLNLLSLSNNLSNGKKKIVFLDELDAVITSRDESNDVGEHSRVVATFIKFLDNLSEDVILISATNLFEKIDSAILRRFSIKMETKNLTSEEFFSKYNSEEARVISAQSINILKKVFENVDFAVSDIDYLKNQILIEEKFNKNLDLVVEVIFLFKSKINNSHIKEVLSNKKYIMYKRRLLDA